LGSLLASSVWAHTQARHAEQALHSGCDLAKKASGAELKPVNTVVALAQLCSKSQRSWNSNQ